MSATRARINIYVPAVNRFPELKREQHPNGRLHPHSLSARNKTDPSAVAEVAAGVMEEDIGVEGSGRSLYVVDSRGCLLEHVRYQGSDYRGALRAAVSARPKMWKE
ncbi:hypothetical protein KR222_010711 [Zaprionus bogoriensis]|nr:hypothetical protein KR222_010711 [Zaprionus bogoriensis]